MEITITTQEELDKLPESFKEFTYIYIHSTQKITVRKAWGNSSVVARGNSSVVARENSSVEAWENSSVVAWGNSSVVARENSGVHCYTTGLVLLFGFAVVWIEKQIKDCNIQKKSKKSTIIVAIKKQPKNGKPEVWFDNEAVENKKTVILYKKVSKDFKTQEGKVNETQWTLGSILEHKTWNPSSQECGEGKFHACSRPYFCDEFRSLKDDKYIALEINKKDLYAWENPRYPHKIGFRKAKVLYVCNKHGKKIEN